ncbi:hypothetical protein [Haliovirga abyssi]|nr:hypothetical protein [Haliovirga abyssi]
MPDYYIPELFSNTIYKLNELIIITDIDGKILFKNHNFFIIDIKSIDFIYNNNIISIFNNFNVTTLTKESNSQENIFKIFLNNKEYYLSYVKDKIKKNSNYFFIYKIKDISSFYSTLMELDKKNTSLKYINFQLTKYSDKNKEYNYENRKKELLNNIQNSLGHNIIELVKLLESYNIIKGNSNKKYSILTKSINKSRKILTDIRNTVNNFKK